MKKVTVIFKHCRGHQKEPTKGTDEHTVWFGNFSADKLATSSYDQL